MPQTHKVRVEATVKVTVETENVIDWTSIDAIKQQAKVAAEKLIDAGIKQASGYRSLRDGLPEVKSILDTTAATINVGKITIDL